MSRRAIKAINWAALAEFIPEREKSAFIAFKAKSDQYLQRMNANPETPPKIDWTYYKKNIPVSGLVDKFQKEYETVSIPYPADSYTSLIETKEKQLMVEMENFVKESNKSIEEAKAKIEEIKGLVPFSEMTMEDFRDAYPEYAINALEKPTAWPHTPESQPENETSKPGEAH